MDAWSDWKKVNVPIEETHEKKQMRRQFGAKKTKQCKNCTHFTPNTGKGGHCAKFAETYKSYPGNARWDGRWMACGAFKEAGNETPE